VLLPVAAVDPGQLPRLDYEEVLRVALFGGPGEVERSRDYRLRVNYHHLVVCDGVAGINKVGILELARKVAEEYFSDLWLLSRMASIFTPRLWASTRALAMGVEEVVFQLEQRHRERQKATQSHASAKHRTPSTDLATTRITKSNYRAG
jgi:hypothetical protein